MKIVTSISSAKKGSAMVTAIVFAGILGVTVLAMMSLTSFRLSSQFGRWHSNQAYYHAENVLTWAGQVIADDRTGSAAPPFIGTYSVSGGTITLPYLQQMASTDSNFEDAWLAIENHTNGIPDLYQIRVSAKVAGKVRSIRSTTRKNPPSPIFDYEYFLNNWGWWWGSTITGHGDNRANWDFDFRFNPTVNGSVMSNGQIESNLVPVDPFGGSPPFAGMAGSDPLSYVHSGSPRLTMPNLLDFTDYEQNAVNENGTVTIGGNVVVSAVHNDPSTPGFYLEGSDANPIVIDGPVVIPGDLLIKGKVTGIGTFYVGGNLYVINDMSYANGPDFSSPPSTMTPAARDQWVDTAISDNSDLVAFAVRENIYGGNPNSSVVSHN